MNLLAKLKRIEKSNIKEFFLQGENAKMQISKKILKNLKKNLTWKKNWAHVTEIFSLALINEYLKEALPNETFAKR